MVALVILPTYQEAENIRHALTRVREVVPEAHVLVVDDGSPDGTADLAEQVGEELGQIHVLRRPAKAGLGPAYRAGFAWGIEHGHDVMVEMDADGQHDPATLPELISTLETAPADLVIGSRYVPGGAVPGWPANRRLLSQWGNRYIGLMLKLGIRDATAGFRAYRTTIIERIGLERVRADGYGFQIEMAYEVRKAGGRIVEIPITFRDRRLGVSKMSSNIVREALVMVTRWGVRDRVQRVRGRLNRARS
ncbi:MAG: polyprenol monophosphomannose synthase [Microthrixaceae bacterium]|nr:polyprenol monophosphomannose synthase [Acidimicrobiales bacterium]MCB9404317.1 polyprenol monophosphomannose synthase [Microthrixaceae bacterium]